MSRELVQVNLERDKRFGLVCPSCGGPMHCNRISRQTARDLPLGSALLVLLVYPAIQGRCPSCGAWSTIHPPGIDPHARATRRLMEFVSRAARFLPLSHIHDLVKVDDVTAGRWDRAILRQSLPPPKLDDLRTLLIDEKAVRKHHGYVTLVMNGENGELLYLAEGKKKQSLQGFFDQLSVTQKASIKAVAMDRAGAYLEVVKDQSPQADIVFDKFHLIANYNAVIDEVRREEWRKASAEDKHVIKGQRYNLFRRPENRTAEQAQSLQRLVEMNSNLAMTDLLKDALHQIWEYRYPGAAVKYLLRWVDWAKASAIPAVQKFGRNLLRVQKEVLNFCKYRITTGPLEAFNNTISRIIHRACGMQNLDYLFLKLRQESIELHLQK
jgi:transposase